VASAFLEHASFTFGMFLAATGLNALAFRLWLLAMFLKITVLSITPGALLHPDLCRAVACRTVCLRIMMHGNWAQGTTADPTVCTSAIY